MREIDIDAVHYLLASKVENERYTQQINELILGLHMVLHLKMQSGVRVPI